MKKVDDWWNQKVSPKGITGGHLREIGMADKDIRKLTYAQADDILLMWEPLTPTEPQKRYTCRYCGHKVLKYDVAITGDDVIVCRKCAGYDL